MALEVSVLFSDEFVLIVQQPPPHCWHLLQGVCATFLLEKQL